MSASTCNGRCRLPDHVDGDCLLHARCERLIPSHGFQLRCRLNKGHVFQRMECR